MSGSSPLRVRRPLRELQADYDKGEKAPLEDLMRAWKGIKELPADDPRSFFMLGGYHGEPFRGGGWGNSTYWGGYCNHGNVLFPTWHRVYLLKLEDALRSIPGCSNVTLPFWDETSEESLAHGIPWALTDENFELDGEKIDNPLRSFVLPRAIQDNVQGANPNYSKPKGYETVRYPFSGLVGTESDRKATEAHNEKCKEAGYEANVGRLNKNVVDWLTSEIIIEGKPVPTHVAKKYADCLRAPNYTVFSNTTSAGEWNANLEKGPPVVPLESPHNSVHLAVGGFEAAGGDFSPLAGANGDMGENDTAGLDPIFFFHHCHVDRMFWLWQKQNGHTDELEIIDEYPGTNSADSQGATPGIVPNSWLTLETPLNPFKHEDGSVYTSLDSINIEKQLGYTYAKGSLEEAPAKLAAVAGNSTKTVAITRVNRAPIRGSFVITATAVVDGERHMLGAEAVLSRWSVQGCANCQTHLEVKAFFGLHALPAAWEDGLEIEVGIHGRDGDLTRPVRALAAAEAVVAPALFKVEVR